MEHLPDYIGRYQVLGLLGTGGMAEILLARIHGPSGFERPVVIKRILPHLAREQRFRDMFLDEARIVAGIRHQNVVHVHELGQEGGELHLVMEYLEGESASTLTRRLASNRKLLNYGLCAHLLAEVAAGLHAAHEVKNLRGHNIGLVHRDVSPANVFVTYNGEIKMIDFGIAVAADRRSQTDAGQVKGKYAYMSPEQCMGHRLDRRSDIFSLGIVMYELSTCRRLFKRQSDMLTLQAICHDPVMSPVDVIPDYPEALARVALKALSKNPDERYASALDMRRDLLDVVHQLNGSKVPEESLGKVMRRLFPDRIEDKRLMLTKIREGVEVTHLPTVDIDGVAELEAVDPRLPVVTIVPPLIPSTLPSGPPAVSLDFPQEVVSAKGVESFQMASPTRPLSAPPPRSGTGSFTRAQVREVDEELSVVQLRPHRRRTIWMASMAAVLMIGASWLLAGVWSAQDYGSGGLTAFAEQIEVSITTEPPGAHVDFAGVSRGETPVTFWVPQSHEEVRLVLSLAHHKLHEERLTPDRDQRIRLVLSVVDGGGAGRDAVVP